MAIPVWFSNPGEIDIRAVVTLGVSVKQSDSAVGYFGTGLKYAIATLLRTEHQITIWSGATSYIFSTEDTSIRGVPFKLVCMNGVQLGFTTELGKNWTPMEAFRELACNATDEGGEFGYSIPASNTPNKTLILVTGKGITEAYLNRNKLFLDTKPLWATSEIEVHPRREGTQIFYRGVLVHKTPSPAHFSYNILRKTTLTEDRTLRNIYDHIYELADVLLQAPTREYALCSIFQEDGVGVAFENSLDFNWTALRTKVPPLFTKTFKETLCRRGSARINSSLLRLMRTEAVSALTPAEIKISHFDRTELENAIAFCSWLGHPISNKVRVCNRLPANALGQVFRNGNEIWIAKSNFDKGFPCLIATLLEEQLHLDTNFADCSREMQEYLLNRMVALAIKLHRVAPDA